MIANKYLSHNKNRIYQGKIVLEITDKEKW